MSVPRIRIRTINSAPIQGDGEYVLYWMIANRRTRHNFALQHALELAQELARPLVVLEALRADYPYASDRLHRFVMQGMADNAARFARTEVAYYAFVETAHGEGKGLLAELARRACVVVTDLSPGFFLPRMVAAAAGRIAVRLEQVDSCGIAPLALAESPFPLAHSFRRFLQKNLAPHLREFPAPDPLAAARLPRLSSLPQDVVRRYRFAAPDLLAATPAVLAGLPIDHRVAPVEAAGGATAAEQRLSSFLAKGLASYDEDRNHPDLDAASGLSPWLHFGHVSAHQIVARVLEREGWSEERLAPRQSGSRTGWWGVSAPAEAFLDQLITWRELGHNMAFRRADAATYEALPSWAIATLEKHASDPREVVYARDRLEAGRTHDRVWNAAQAQLVREGRMHNYLRMLWGKKILEWSAHPRDALETMLELNDRYALDGRDPNSVSGICWVLGRYDRAWGPERDVHGTVRYMSSANTVRKVRIRQYLERWAP